MIQTVPSHHTPTDLPAADVVDVAEQLGIDFGMAPFSVEELKLGMEVELEQGRLVAATTDIASTPDDDLTEAGLHAVTHLQQRHDFYTLLTRAHAPGDPTPPLYDHVDIGTD